MSIQGLSLFFSLLLVCFFKESICICDGTIWTKVGWEIFPEEMYFLQVKSSPSHCLPYPLDKLCCNFANLDIFHSCFNLIYISVQALVLILSVLSAHYLCMKWKKHQKKLKKQVSLETSGNDENHCAYDIDQILSKLAATTSMMTKYLNQVSKHPPAKKFKYHKLRGRRVKGEKLPENKRHLHM